MADSVAWTPATQGAVPPARRRCRRCTPVDLATADSRRRLALGVYVIWLRSGRRLVSLLLRQVLTVRLLGSRFPSALKLRSRGKYCTSSFM